MDQAEEIRKIIEQTQAGNWIPITIVSGVFSIVILLLLYIWNQMLKNNAARHAANERILETVTDTQQKLYTMVEVAKTERRHLKEDVDRNTDDISEIKKQTPCKDRA